VNVKSVMSIVSQVVLISTHQLPFQVTTQLRCNTDPNLYLTTMIAT
jgi:hypothetical protein